jgi:predicted ATPase
MRGYILTGMPGSGKTSVITYLEQKHFSVVHEAATDVIVQAQQEGWAAPWQEVWFLERVACLQKQREEQASAEKGVCFFDRSVLCTYALGVYLKAPMPSVLLDEKERVVKNKVYMEDVFFIQHLGFVQATQARRISFEEALKFEAVHRAVYVQHGYRLIDVHVGAVEKRSRDILKHVFA